MSSLTDIKVGTVVKVNGDPFLVTKNQFMRKDAGKPVMRTKLKNLKTGNTLDKTFLAGESFEFADIERRKCQYLYKDSSEANFMDNESFEQFSLPLAGIEDLMEFLKEDTEVHVTFYEGAPIGVQPPIKITLEITETTPGVKGDTATGGTKQATVETGAVILVPLFIKEGDKVLINTETGEYVSRITD
ncbi:elongation factor P [Patescibacteria group bacterium]|nr:elongation factor P [Patescibacteria group bacterium]